MYNHLSFVSYNGCTHARAALRWPCGLGLGGMVGSALLAAFIIFSSPLLCSPNPFLHPVHQIIHHRHQKHRQNQ